MYYSEWQKFKYLVMPVRNLVRKIYRAGKPVVYQDEPLESTPLIPIPEPMADLDRIYEQQQPNLFYPELHEPENPLAEFHIPEFQQPDNPFVPMLQTEIQHASIPEIDAAIRGLREELLPEDVAPTSLEGALPNPAPLDLEDRLLDAPNPLDPFPL